MYFCKGHDYGQKVDVSKGRWNPKRKMWVTTHFSEIIKQPLFQVSVKIQRMYGNFFPTLSLIVEGWRRKFVKDLLGISFQSLCSVYLGGFIAPNRMV